MLNIKDIIERNHKEPKEITEIREKIINSFKDLEFQEGPHKYYLHNPDGTTTELPSVSATTHQFQPHVDWDLKAEQFALKNGLTYEHVKRMWEENNIRATNSGTKTHLYGEAMMNFVRGNIDGIPDLIKPQYEKGYLIPYGNKEQAIMKFFEDLHNVDDVYPIMPEAQVYMGLNQEYSDIQPYAGTFDILVGIRTKNGIKLAVWDWKTNASLTNDYARNTNGMCLSPFSYLYDEALSYYYLQLNAYALCINQLGYEIIDRRIIWLKEDGTYEKVKVPDMTKELIAALQKSNS